MTRSLRIPFLGLAALAAVMATNPTVSATGQSERTIYVSVMDGNGAPVPDMKQADFVVKEGDSPSSMTDQTITKVERASEPLNYAILVDTTPAAAKVVNDLREALKGFCELLLSVEPKTRFSIVEFGGASMTTLEFTSDMSEIEAAILKLIPKPSESVLNEAIVDVAKTFAKMPPTSRNVILTINMEPTSESSNVQPKIVAEEVRKSGATMWSVALQDGTRRDANREQLLKGLTANSGGRWVALQQQKQLAGFLRSIAANSFSQYAVTYTRSGSASAKTITDVQATRQGVVALSLKWNRQ